MTSRLLIATALFSALAAAPAMASFTLIAPEPAAAPGNNTITAIPMAPMAAAPAPAIQQAPAAMAAPAPQVLMAPQPVQPQPATLASPQAFESPVRGFGKDIPLVIAAQQIAPEGRQIAFGQGVDPSMPISWDGGKPWRNVLSDALNKSGLQVAEQGNILFISRGNSTTSPTNASLLMEPKSQWTNDASAPPAMQPMAQPQPPMAPGYLPPSAPAPMQMNSLPPAAPVMPAPNTVALPTMVMPPAAPVAPIAAAPVVMPPANNMIMPAQPMMAPANNNMMAPAPRAMVADQSVIPPQQPVAIQQAMPTMQSSIIEVPVAPPTIPVAATPIMPIKNTDAATISSGSWHTTSGQTLKQALEDWSSRSNVSLRWDSEFDYPVQSSVNFEGDYETAVRTLLRGFSSAQPQPIARLYRPTQGAPGVLVVTTRGNDMGNSR